MSTEAPSLLRLGLIASLILVLPSTCGRVEGIHFAFNGFTGVSDLYSVPGSNWVYDPDYSSIYLATLGTGWDYAVAGRLLYPALVRMRDPITHAAKSFSTTFVVQIYLPPYRSGIGPGMAFIMVPDNSTLGSATNDYMGLLTVNTSQTVKNSESDDHTFGVEIDTHKNPEFNDPNDNHVGIDLASMNSTHTYIPTIVFPTDHADIFLHMWIDYFQADSRMEIYITQYGQDKPAIPLGSDIVDLSLLNQDMYVGFTAAVGLEGQNLHTILAWSFSTDGPAPSVWIARDAPPSPSPPSPAPPPPPRSPPPPTPTAPSVPAAPAPNPPPPKLPSLPPPYLSSPPPPLPWKSPPPPDSPVVSPPPNTGSNKNSRIMSVGAIVGIVTGVITTVSTIAACCWKPLRRRLNK